MQVIAEQEEICYINNDVQKRGSSFPIFFPESKDPETVWDSLIDSGATRSCMNYDAFIKIGNGNLRQRGTHTAADGGNLGASGKTTCKIRLGTETAKQDFIVCTYLKQNVILRINFAHSNYAGIEWTKEGTRILTLRRKNVIEVTKDELGIPVTTKRKVTIPLRMGGIFHVDINEVFNTNQVLTPHSPYFEEMPMIYPHKIVVPPVGKEDDKFMHVMHITNVGADKLLYIKKGDIVAFAHPESETVQYMDVLGPECEIKQNLQVRPMNWISKSASVSPIEVQETFISIEDTIKGEVNLLNLVNLQTKRKTVEENNENSLKSLKTDVEQKEITRQYGEVSENYMTNRRENEENSLKSLKTNVKKKETTRQYGEVSENYVVNRYENEENSHESLIKKKGAEDKWTNIQEIVESDFLTSPADIYPKRQVELEDAKILGKTKEQFAQLCNEYDEKSFPRITRT